MSSGWSSLVLKNFNEAASTYNGQARLQRAVAWRLAKHCAKQQIPEGLWVDLGSGTGLMANALETCIPQRTVFRVDGCSEMLKLHHRHRPSQLWDLNLGLPPLPGLPTLLVSSFALHWLSNPQDQLKEWLAALAPGGLLALALPVHGSFPQWHHAAAAAGVACSAMPLPSQSSLLDALPRHCIRYQQLHHFTQQSGEVFSLLRPMRQMGAQSSPYPALGVANWRRLAQAWPSHQKDGVAELTWLIQLLLIQR
ncbi:MAG: methyltransferase domain-containing protein [Prochlorococcus sp.]